MLPDEPERSERSGWSELLELSELLERSGLLERSEAPDEPDEALRPDWPLLLEPDIPLELLELPEPDIPPEFSLLPEDPAFRSRSCDELEELPLIPLERSDEELPDALRGLPCELDDPELPPTPPVLEPLDDACRSRSDAACPSPCDELPRSRFELADEALLSPWPLFDEPEVFRSRSAI